METKCIKDNFVPIFIELLFVVSCFIVEKQFYIYTSNFNSSIYFYCILLYYYFGKYIS